MTPEVWYQIDRSHFHFVLIQSDTTLIDLFLFFSRSIQLRSVPTPSRPRFRWKDMVEGLIYCFSFLWLCDDWLRTFRFLSSLFRFHLSAAWVRHVPIRMVSSIWGRFSMPWPRVSSGICEWVGTSKSRPPVLILRSWTRVEVPGSFDPFEPSDSSW